MTQIRRLTDGTRRPGVLGVHSLDHFSMTVPNLEQARHFYQSFGLDVREEGRGLALYAPGLEHRWGILNQGQSKKLHDLSFGAFEDDLPRFRDRQSVHVNGSRRRPASKATGCGSTIITACWWKSASRKNPRPTRNRCSPLTPHRRAGRARATAATPR